MACSGGSSAPSPLNPGILVSGQNSFAEAAGADGAEQSRPPSLLVKVECKAKQ